MYTDIATLMKQAHETAVSKGWWDAERNFGEQLALMHSELSEALEAYRDLKDPLTELPIIDFENDAAGNHKPIGVASEFADVLIRIFDTCERYGIPLALAIDEKMAYNRGGMVERTAESGGSTMQGLHFKDGDKARVSTSAGEGSAYTGGCLATEAQRPVQSATILDEAGVIINGDREQTYGRPSDNLDRIAKLWAAILGCDVTAAKVCLCMAALKLARLVNQPDHRDSQVDACGYMALLERIQEK